MAVASLTLCHRHASVPAAVQSRANEACEGKYKEGGGGQRKAGAGWYLLAHSTLVGVPGRLVVVGVGDEACHHPQHCERLNLQVSGVPDAFGLIQGHQSIAFLVHIQVLHKAMMQEMVETPLAIFELADVLCCDSGDAFITDD